jgi:3-isopropylmalate/(R)-2-methylmalate dehydratase small subunit
MSKVTRIAGRAVALRGNDIDTDRIMPARFLKAVTFAGLEANLFEDDRRALAEQGGLHPFDDPVRQDAAVLLVHANFGCGSSREHAPQAIRRRGIEVIVGESFAEIFAGNALMIGLACVTTDRANLDKLFAAADADHDAEFVVDLEAGTATTGSLTVPIEMPAPARAALLSGEWDATGLLLDRYEAVERVAARLPYAFPRDVEKRLRGV